jgi:hypothetical protein
MKTSRKLAIALVSILVTGFGTAASAYGELTESQLATLQRTCNAIHYGDLVPAQLDWLEDEEYRALIQSCAIARNAVGNGSEATQLSADDYVALEAKVTSFESRMTALEALVAPLQQDTVPQDSISEGSAIAPEGSEVSEASEGSDVEAEEVSVSEEAFASEGSEGSEGSEPGIEAVSEEAAIAPEATSEEEVGAVEEASEVSAAEQPELGEELLPE